MSKPYIIVEAPSVLDLQKQVNLYIKLGYKPTGGLCHYGVASRLGNFIQALYLEEKK